MLYFFIIIFFNYIFYFYFIIRVQCDTFCGNSVILTHARTCKSFASFGIIIIFYCVYDSRKKDYNFFVHKWTSISFINSPRFVYLQFILFLNLLYQKFKIIRNYIYILARNSVLPQTTVYVHIVCWICVKVHSLYYILWCKLQNNKNCGMNRPVF